MLKNLIVLIAGSVLGFVGASLLFWFAIIPYYGGDIGRKNGAIDGCLAVAAVLEKEFGDYDGHTPYKILYEVKTTDVISIETNGVKTIRVIP